MKSQVYLTRLLQKNCQVLDKHWWYFHFFFSFSVHLLNWSGRQNKVIYSMQDSRPKQKNTWILTLQSGRYPMRIMANEPVRQKRSASVARKVIFLSGYRCFLSRNYCYFSNAAIDLSEGSNNLNENQSSPLFLYIKCHILELQRQTRMIVPINRLERRATFKPDFFEFIVLFACLFFVLFCLFKLR